MEVGSMGVKGAAAPPWIFRTIPIRITPGIRSSPLG
jgi:hypothetical protein